MSPRTFSWPVDFGPYAPWLGMGNPDLEGFIFFTMACVQQLAPAVVFLFLAGLQVPFGGFARGTPLQKVPKDAAQAPWHSKAGCSLVDALRPEGEARESEHVAIKVHLFGRHFGPCFL